MSAEFRVLITDKVSDTATNAGREKRRPHKDTSFSIDLLMEPTTGFEPVTCCLRNSCSTPELRWPVLLIESQMAHRVNRRLC